VRKRAGLRRKTGRSRLHCWTSSRQWYSWSPVHTSWTPATAAETARVCAVSIQPSTSAVFQLCSYYSAPYSGAKYCDDRVCVCLSAREYISGNTRSIFTIFVHVTHGCGSVLLWRCRDTLCTSDFIDDVILAHKPRQLNVAAQLIEAQPTCSLRLGLNRRVGIPVAGQWTHTYWPTFRAPRSCPTRLQWVCWIFMTSYMHCTSLRTVYTVSQKNKTPNSCP